MSAIILLLGLFFYFFFLKFSFPSRPCKQLCWSNSSVDRLRINVSGEELWKNGHTKKKKTTLILKQNKKCINDVDFQRKKHTTNISKIKFIFSWSIWFIGDYKRSKHNGKYYEFFCFVFFFLCCVAVDDNLKRQKFNWR